MRERLSCLLAAWKRFISPPPFEDEDPQSNRRRHSCPDRIHPGQST